METGLEKQAAYLQIKIEKAQNERNLYGEAIEELNRKKALVISIYNNIDFVDDKTLDQIEVSLRSGLADVAARFDPQIGQAVAAKARAEMDKTASGRAVTRAQVEKTQEIKNRRGQTPSDEGS